MPDGPLAFGIGRLWAARATFGTDIGRVLRSLPPDALTRSSGLGARRCPRRRGWPRPSSSGLQRAGTLRQVVAGRELEVLGLPARALLLALHAAHHGERTPQPLADLSRGLDLVDEGVWDAAAALGHRLNAVHAMGMGLRLVPSGGAVAHRLRLPASAPLDIVLKAWGSPPMSRQFALVAQTSGIGAKLRLVVRELVPTPAYLRSWRPVARRGRLGLGIAYLWRPAHAFRQTPAAVRALRRARRV